MELTILMPCLNEARTLRKCIEDAQAFIAENNIHGEVLVADNGSIDGSQAIAMEMGARVEIAQQRGYGAALSAGIRAAQGRFVIMGDSDDSYDFSLLEPFIGALRAGNDLVMGNRFRGGIMPGAMPFLHRYLGNPVLSFLGRAFFRTDIGDFHCGLRGFRRDAMLQLNLVSPGMEFASEMVAKSALAGLSIAEVPTTLRPDGRGRPPHLRTWRDGWRHLLFMLLYCPRWLFLFPGLALLIVGVAGYLLIGSGPLVFGNVGLDIHSLLYMAAFCIVGSQLVQFALLTKWIGVVSGIVPRPAWLLHAQRFMNVETGIIAGLTMGAAGFVWSTLLLQGWSNEGYGALLPQQFMRSVIPAITLMVLGIQTIAGTLFAGALLLCWNSGAANQGR